MIDSLSWLTLSRDLGQYPSFPIELFIGYRDDHLVIRMIFSLNLHPMNNEDRCFCYTDLKSVGSRAKHLLEGDVCPPGSCLERPLP